MRQFWELDAFEYGDMPTLHDLFAWADEFDIARSVLATKGEHRWTGDEEGYPEAVLKVVETVRAIVAVKPSDDAGRRLLVPRELFDADSVGMRIDCGIELEWIELADIARAEEALEGAWLAMCGEDLGQGSKEPAGHCIVGYATNFAPWRDILGARVWLGEGWRRAEIYEMLASTFWELTFHGPEPGYVDAVLENLAEEIGRAKTANSAPGKPIEILAGRLGVERDDDFGRGRCESAADLLNHVAEIDFLERLVDLDGRLAAGAERYGWESDEREDAGDV